MNSEFLKQAIKYLESQDIEILEVREKNSTLSPLDSAKLEEIPRKPQLLVRWKGETFFFYCSNKEEFFPSKDGNLKTGGDWPTFSFLKAIGEITKIEVYLLMHEAETNQWLIKQFSQLQAGEPGHRDRCLKREYRYDKLLNCYDCWRNHKSCCSKCLNGKQPTVLWKTDLFPDKMSNQPKLIK